jgi:hypothetical protein
MMEHEIVRALIRAAELAPTEEESAALVDAYPVVKTLIDLVHSVPESRYGEMCLTFDPRAEHFDWH